MKPYDVNLERRVKKLDEYLTHEALKAFVITPSEGGFKWLSKILPEETGLIEGVIDAGIMVIACFDRFSMKSTKSCYSVTFSQS